MSLETPCMQLVLYKLSTIIIYCYLSTVGQCPLPMLLPTIVIFITQLSRELRLSSLEELSSGQLTEDLG